MKICNLLSLKNLSLYSCHIFLIIYTTNSLSQPSASVKKSVLRKEGETSETLILPYAFTSEGMGTVFGLGAMRKGFLQPQMISGVTAFSGKESQAVAMGIWDFSIPYTQRWYLSFAGMYGDYPRNKAYSSGQSYVPENQPRPGSNNSSKEQFLLWAGVSSWNDFRLEYALPIGATANNGRVDYHLRRGLLISEPSGGEHWNPLDSGASVLVFRQYNRHQNFINEDKVISGKVNAFSIGLLYDNSDFPVNPEKGSKQYIALHSSFDDIDSPNYWNFAEIEMSKYLSLGSTNWARQRILAFNTWLAYSPSWKTESNEKNDTRPTHNPPHNEGATLGGFYKMRGFDLNRFNDKAALYVTAEYRYTLEYNPIEKVDWLKFLNMDWAQLAFFAEAGRVSSSMDQTLLEDMKMDVGLGIRALMAGTIIRLDMAYSKENLNIWVMIGQPF